MSVSAVDKVLDTLYGRPDGTFVFSRLEPPELELVVTRMSESVQTVHRTEGSASPTGAILLEAWARDLSFPDYYGHNWEALDEILGDHETRPRSATLIVVDRADQLLRRATKRHQGILAGILKSLPGGHAASNYAHEPATEYPPLWMLLNAAPESNIPPWLLAAGWPVIPR